MRDFLTFLVAGITGGSSYALLALGLVLVNKSSRILNFAQGEVGAMATFVTASLAVSHGWPWLLAILVGLAVGAAISVVTSLVLLQRESGGRLPPLVGTVALLGLLVILENRYLGGTRPFPSPVHGKGVTLAGVVITPTRMLVIGSVAVTCVLLWLLVEKTRVGLALRAGADNREAATVIGLNARGVQAIAWLLAGVLGVLAGVFLGWTNQSISPGFLTAALPRAFTAAILGGMTSLPGAVLGGVIVGVAESMTRWKWGQTPGSPELVVFLILFLTLVLRPQGLLGGRSSGLATEGTESLVTLRGLVRVPPARPRAWYRRVAPLAVLVVAAVATGIFPSEPTAYKLSYIPVLALLALSLNSFTSATGQLSLGHVGIYGLGAFMCGIAVSTWGLPSPLGVIVAMLVTGLVSLLLGLVALRIRGLYLAVLTLAFAVVLQAFVFPRPAFSRGGAGLRVNRPQWFGIDFTNDRAFLVLCVVALGLVWLIDRWILGSPMGRSMLAVRQNETAAAARAIHPPSVKVTSFVLSGIGAGLAGGLYAWRQGIVVATSFPIEASFTLILYVVLGGIGSRVGVFIITAIFAWTTTWSSGGNVLEWLTIIGSAFTILQIGRHPEGLAGINRELFEKLRERWRPHAPTEGAEPVAPMAAGSVVEPPRRVEFAPLVVRLADGRRIEPVLLAAREITIRFGEVDALRNVSVDVLPGQIVGVIGPNGAGKTTLFNCLSGFVTPNEGRVWFAGRDVSRWSPSKRAGAGLGRTFQQGGLAMSETALANLLIAQHTTLEPVWPPSALGTGPGQAAAERRRRAVAEEVLDLLNLRSAEDRPAGDLSYGNRKLLEMGCALVSRPRVLLLDEPAAGLADDEVAGLAKVIEGIRSQLGVAVLVIEHHVPLVKEVADTVSVLNFGLLLAAGDPDTVTRDPAVVEAYLGQHGLAAERGRRAVAK